uniref:Uncharacterized protein n=1 Tax=Ditylenchus dipsaci TaxID=166011 RepID=A0A915DNV3_9BILA
MAAVTPQDNDSISWALIGKLLVAAVLFFLTYKCVSYRSDLDDMHYRINECNEKISFCYSTCGAREANRRQAPAGAVFIRQLKMEAMPKQLVPRPILEIREGLIIRLMEILLQETEEMAGVDGTLIT